MLSDRQKNNALACQTKLSYDVYVCLFLYLLHSEYHNHSTAFYYFGSRMQ